MKNKYENVHDIDVSPTKPSDHLRNVSFSFWQELMRIFILMRHDSGSIICFRCLLMSTRHGVWRSRHRRKSESKLCTDLSLVQFRSSDLILVTLASSFSFRHSVKTRTAQCRESWSWRGRDPSWWRRFLVGEGEVTRRKWTPLRLHMKVDLMVRLFNLIKASLPYLAQIIRLD